jgi:hypothetical protein
MRGRGMKHSRAEGAKRFAVFVGAAALANKLMIIAALLMRSGRAAGRPPKTMEPLSGAQSTPSGGCRSVPKTARETLANSAATVAHGET